MEVWATGVVPTKLTRYSNISETIPTNNYWAPLTEQVEDSEIKENIKSKEILHNFIHKKFNTAVFDTAATSSAGKPGDNFIPTTEISGKYLTNQEETRWKQPLSTNSNIQSGNLPTE